VPGTVRDRSNIMKRNILSLIFILGIGISLFPNGKPQEDSFVGKTIDQIILQLGKPSSDNFKEINENYIGFESEPDYSMFFSLDELRKTVQVRIVTWEKRNENYVVWGKKESDEWVIFSSLRWRKNTYF